MQNFQDSGLRAEIVQAITEMGFESPTTIQAQAIPFLLEEQRDLVALAQTGTGKTAAFSLPLLHQMDASSRDIQALVLCPTRELCIQVSKEITNFVKHMKGMKAIAIYGGESMEKQKRALRTGGQIVIGTPGRTKDMIQRKYLKVNNIKWLVLDEADEMLTMGFKDDLDSILSNTPEEKQTLLFSATMPREIEGIADNYMQDPKLISAGKRNISAENISHQYFIVKGRDKYQALQRILEYLPGTYGVVFCRTRKDTQELATQLVKDNFKAEALHGDLPQIQRDRVMNRFRKRYNQLLIATDVAARGIDIDDLTHVINYELPDNPEVYIHRSGRTGRAGKSGTCFSLLTARDLSKISYFERKTKIRFEHKLIPTGQQLCEKKLLKHVAKVESAQVDEEKLQPYLTLVEEKLADLSKEELIRHFIAVEFNNYLDRYQNAPDLNQRKQAGDSYSSRGPDRYERSGSKIDYARFFINVGGNDGLTPPLLIGFINDCINLRKKVKIGKIDIRREESFFELDAEFAKRFTIGYRRMNVNFNGKQVSVDPAPQQKRQRRYQKR